MSKLCYTIIVFILNQVINGLNKLIAKIDVNTADKSIAKLQKISDRTEVIATKVSVMSNLAAQALGTNKKVK